MWYKVVSDPRTYLSLPNEYTYIYVYLRIFVNIDIHIQGSLNGIGGLGAWKKSRKTKKSYTIL